MIYMGILGVLVFSIFSFISYKQKKLVNGLLICTASILIFNVILPILYQMYHPEVKLKYIYIFIYYGIYYLALSSGYYIFSNIKKFNYKIDLKIKSESEIIFKRIIIIMIALIGIFILVNIPIEYLQNPRILYENTRIGFGHLYFVLTMLLNIYFIFAMFTEKKYYYMGIVFILMYFTGSKARMLIPVEMLFLYYFYVKTDERNNIKKILLYGIGVVLCFLAVFIITTKYLPDKGVETIINTLANYSDYNRNFIQLIEKMSETKQYFNGLISLENNFVSLIPRVLWEGKPLIFGSFRLSYMIYPEWTLLFQGAPSFGTFGSIFADFGHLSIILIFIQNFILGSLLAISEKLFIKQKNPITFMLFLIFMGIFLVDIGISAISILIINFIFIIGIYISLRLIVKIKRRYNEKNSI